MSNVTVVDPLSGSVNVGVTSVDVSEVRFPEESNVNAMVGTTPVVRSLLATSISKSHALVPDFVNVSFIAFSLPASSKTPILLVYEVPFATSAERLAL